VQYINKYRQLKVLRIFYDCITIFCVQAITDGVVGRAPNYLLSDTVALLADWCRKTTSLPAKSDNYLVSQLLNLLISNVHHSRRDVFKHNLELIRTVVELWKPNFDIPIQLLYDMIMVSRKFEYFSRF
jgi:hypothetical protein